MDKGSCLKRRYVAVNERNLRIGESHGRSTISDELVAQVRFLHGIKGRTYGYISMRTGLSRQTISKLCRWKTRGQKPAGWVRVDGKGKRVRSQGENPSELSPGCVRVGRSKAYIKEGKKG